MLPVRSPEGRELSVMSDEREQLILGLRELADFLETHPDFPKPTSLGFSVFLYGDKDIVRSDLAKLARVLGQGEKDYYSNTFQFTKKFSGGLDLTLMADRDKVCTAKVVGTKEVPERIIPAHTEDIVEWECRDSILK